MTVSERLEAMSSACVYSPSRSQELLLAAVDPMTAFVVLFFAILAVVLIGLVVFINVK